MFEKRFIYDSYSCRVGKGTHAASKRLRRFLRQVSRNNTRTVYALKLDVRKFFDTVDHETLRALLRRVVKCEHTRKLLAHIIDSFETAPAKGLPLGNLTSQLFANVYLHELDRFVKHELREKHYLRYCDDFVILGTDCRQLAGLIQPIYWFLNSRLNLDIHTDKIFLRTWHRGVDFVGYVHKPGATLLRSTTRKRMVRRVNECNVTSYAGLCTHADAYEIHCLLENIIGVTKVE